MSIELSRRSFLVSASVAPLTLAPLAVNASAAIRPRSTLRLPIKVGQIGTGHAHASGKWETFNRFPDLYQVVGICESDERQRAKASAQAPYREANWISEAELMKQAELIVVETNVGDLVATAARAIEAGKHIHLDKPGGTQLSDFSDLLDQAQQRGLLIQMGYMFRYNPAFKSLFTALQSGWLGQIREINGAIGKQAGAEMRNELGQYPGGGMFELACHLIDAVVTIMGPPDNVHAFNRQTRDDPFVDNQLAVFEYPRATAAIRCNHDDPFGGPHRQFSVVGDAGSIEIRPLEPAKLSLMIDRQRGDFAKGTHQIDFPHRGRYDGDFEDLAAVLSGKKEFQWDYAHDRAVQKAVLEASGMKLD